MRFTLKLLVLFIILINSAFAIEKSSISLEQNPTISNVEINIQQSRLMENEVSNFKKKLLIIQEKYRLNNDKVIIKSLYELDKIIFILRKIQTTKINKNTAENVIKIIINDLKNINFITKNHLKKIKTKLDYKRNKYNILAIKLSKSIDRIIVTFYNYYKNKKNLTLKDKKIIVLVNNLQVNSTSFKNFKNQKLYNIQDIKKSLVSILKKVKNNIINIKINLKK